MTYYDRQGNPITADRYAALHRDKDYRQVAYTEIDERICVSTVWLGLDHAYGRSSKPVIFETMIFSDGPLSQECERYCTEAEALVGHNEMVARSLTAKRGNLEPDRDVVVDEVARALRDHYGYVDDRALHIAATVAAETVEAWRRVNAPSKANTSEGDR